MPLLKWLGVLLLPLVVSAQDTTGEKPANRRDRKPGYALDFDIRRRPELLDQILGSQSRGAFEQHLARGKNSLQAFSARASNVRYTTNSHGLPKTLFVDRGALSEPAQ